jgi:hypothetical protein
LQILQGLHFDRQANFEQHSKKLPTQKSQIAFLIKRNSCLKASVERLVQGTMQTPVPLLSLIQKKESTEVYG